MSLHWHTVAPILEESLRKLMAAEEFQDFRLVGGTALSLQFGHRMSIDIDMFTDSPYGSIDFGRIEGFLRRAFSYVSDSATNLVAMGQSYFVGPDQHDNLKLDVYYTDPFIRPIQKVDGIRMASTEEIVAMKVDVVQRGGRKKDFWDLHELMDDYPIESMLALHDERYPYNHQADTIRNHLVDFTRADEDPDPFCLRGKHWELIKYDFVDAYGGGFG